MAVASIDIEGLVQLILKLDVAAGSLRSTCGELRPRARSLHVSTAGLSRAEGIAAWVEEQLPGLRRRLQLALVADAARPANLRGQNVDIIDPVLDAAQAQAAGRALATELLAIEAEGEAGAVQLRDLLARLEEHLGDPEVMSGFYGELGTERTEDLPRFLAEIAPGLEVRTEWADRGAHDLEILSRGFATALHDDDPPDDFRDTVTAFGQRTDDHEQAWARLALLQHGAVPTDHLVRFVQANALDQFVDDPSGDFTGDVLAGGPAMVGLPRDRLELAFNALASDPDAARRAISAGPGTAAMVERVHEYNERGAVRVDEAFGAALAAGSGVDEPAGQHSAAAAEFAFHAITATAGLENTMWFAREHYAAIAAAWAPEFLAGATSEASRVDGSVRTRPAGWEDIPGMRPQFYLSLEDTRDFLEKFGHDDEISAPFDRAVGGLYYDLMTQAVAADTAPEGADAAPGRAEQMGLVASRFGNLAAAQYEAQNAARAELDDQDEAFRDSLGTLAGLAIDHALDPSSRIGSILWEASKVGANKGIGGWVEGDPENTRAGRHDAQTSSELGLQEIAIAHFLVAQEPDRASGLPSSLRPGPGAPPLDPALFVDDPALVDEFETWLTSTNENSTTYDMVTRTTNQFLGGFERTQVALGGV